MGASPPTPGLGWVVLVKVGELVLCIYIQYMFKPNLCSYE